jgi:type I pantothenate kinase
MDIRAAEQQYNPYRIFSREQWARLRDDTPIACVRCTTGST